MVGNSRPQSADPPEASLDGLDDGEQAALVLAGVLNADLLLLDDRDGVRAARLGGFRVIGTLRVLQLASKRGFSFHAVFPVPRSQGAKFPFDIRRKRR